MDTSVTGDVGICRVCSRKPDEHAAGEADGSVNHTFSATGRLERSTLRAGTESSGRRSTVQVMVVPAPDMALRRLLVDLGVVTAEQLATVADVAPVVEVPTA